jgi:hypothetical protein
MWRHKLPRGGARAPANCARLLSRWFLWLRHCAHAGGILVAVDSPQSRDVATNRGEISEWVAPSRPSQQFRSPKHQTQPNAVIVKMLPRDDCPGSPTPKKDFYASAIHTLGIHCRHRTWFDQHYSCCHTGPAVEARGGARRDVGACLSMLSANGHPRHLHYHCSLPLRRDGLRHHRAHRAGQEWQPASMRQIVKPPCQRCVIKLRQAPCHDGRQ